MTPKNDFLTESSSLSSVLCFQPPPTLEIYITIRIILSLCSKSRLYTAWLFQNLKSHPGLGLLLTSRSINFITHFLKVISTHSFYS